MGNDTFVRDYRSRKDYQRELATLVVQGYEVVSIAIRPQQGGRLRRAVQRAAGRWAGIGSRQQGCSSPIASGVRGQERTAMATYGVARWRSARMMVGYWGMPMRG
jgi:hypothetical protein